MEYTLRTIQKADKDRLARAATGLADGSITVKLIHQDSHEARALVRNGSLQRCWRTSQTNCVPWSPSRIKRGGGFGVRCSPGNKSILRQGRSG